MGQGEFGLVVKAVLTCEENAEIDVAVKSLKGKQKHSAHDPTKCANKCANKSEISSALSTKYEAECCTSLDTDSSEPNKNANLANCLLILN